MAISEDDDLQKQYKNLQRDWNSFKTSNPRRRRSCQKPVDDEIIQLMDISTSPRELISSLQQTAGFSASDGWKVRTNDLAIVEIVRERQAAIERGKLKGRRLFEKTDSEEGDQLGMDRKEEICSACSSVLIQRSTSEEVQSFGSSCALYDDDDGDRRRNDCSTDGECSCSCSSCHVYYVESKKKELLVCMESTKLKGGDHDGFDACEESKRWMAPIGWFVLLLLLFALNLMLSWGSFDGDQEDDNLVPT